MTTTTDMLHYHVLAIQDVGGSQEFGRGWDEKRTLAEAEELARDAIEADRPNREIWAEDTPTWEELERKFKPRYGDDWTDLYSSNINPGWEEIYIRPCDQNHGTCDPWCDMASRYSGGGSYPDPWWTPSRGERNPVLVPLPWRDAQQDSRQRELRNAREFMLQLDPARRRQLLTELLTELDGLPMCSNGEYCDGAPWEGHPHPTTPF